MAMVYLKLVVQHCSRNPSGSCVEWNRRFKFQPLLHVFAEIDQNKDRMLEILEGKGLSFLFPLMKLEKELLKQIQADPSPQSIYKWIKDNISPKLHTDTGFVNILMTRYDFKLTFSHF